MSPHISSVACLLVYPGFVVCFAWVPDLDPSTTKWILSPFQVHWITEDGSKCLRHLQFPFVFAILSTEVAVDKHLLSLSSQESRARLWLRGVPIADLCSVTVGWSCNPPTALIGEVPSYTLSGMISGSAMSSCHCVLWLLHIEIFIAVMLSIWY